MNCTQCASGAVDELYETGSILRECGVISGFDMTVEAALTKLSYILGKDEWTLETKKQVISKTHYEYNDSANTLGYFYNNMVKA